ncbi:MAG TPA: hypothetical protein VK936_10695 [Longimicrobiales bacterium]|nr:hypothetical protein [Longimicrobiales bacterium]
MTNPETEAGGGAGPNRPVPYDLVFAAPGFDESRFAVVQEEAESRGAVSAGELLLLPAAGALLRELHPEAVGPGDERDRIARAGALLFHAYRHWRHGRCVYALSERAVRALLDLTESVGPWAFRAPAPAGYVQLPRNLLWARVEEDAVPEPVDGFFWSWPGPEEGARTPRLDLLFCLGVRRGRPGVSLADISLDVAADAEQWADVEARPGGTDFENVLPGGELQGYHALTTQAEALKLAVRCFRRIDAGGATADPESPRWYVLDD